MLAEDADLAPLQQALRLLAPLVAAPSSSCSRSAAEAAAPQAASSSGAPQLPQQQQQQARPAKPPREWAPPRERATQVLLPTSVEQDVPEWFFQRTGQELKAAFLSATRRREQDQARLGADVAAAARSHHSHLVCR